MDLGKLAFFSNRIGVYKIVVVVEAVYFVENVKKVLVEGKK